MPSGTPSPTLVMSHVAAGSAGEWVAGAGEGRPIVVASSHHGLVETELLAEPLGAHDDVLSSAASDGNHKVRSCENIDHLRYQEGQLFGRESEQIWQGGYGELCRNASVRNKM